MMNSPRISVNARAAALIERLRADPAEFRVTIDKGELGETRIDAGSRCQGSIAAGPSPTRICMGGLGTVEITASSATPNPPWTLIVSCPPPVPACLGTQHAGSAI